MPSRIIVVLVALAGGLLLAAPAQANFAGSVITSPASGSEWFYDGDSNSGAITVQGTVSGPTPGAQAKLVCYYAANTQYVVVGGDVPVYPSGAFDFAVSLAPIAGYACRLAVVPFNPTPPTGAAAAAYEGPSISVASLQSYASAGNLYDYQVLSGTLSWSFEFGSLGSCPVLGSFATDPATLGSYWLFAGDACLPQLSGISPSFQTRSSLQIDSLNAYAPAAISTLAAEPGFDPLSYAPVFDANHDTVTITDTEFPMICQAPGGFPPTPATCPALSPSGIEVQQTTTLLPGGEVARVEQQFTSVDGRSHTIDAMFSQAVQAPAQGGVPGFEFPGQGAFSAHNPGDSYTAFPSGPGSVFVIGNVNALPAVSNPAGAISYSSPPLSANFVPGGVNSVTGLPLSDFVMHYMATVPAGGTVNYGWSFTQASSTQALTPLERIERDRFSKPSVAITSPARAGVTHAGQMTIRGVALDPVGIASVSIDGQAASVASNGAFAYTIELRPGTNVIDVTATNVAGNTSTSSITVVYKPRCVVPRLRRKTLAAARAALRRAECRVGRVRRVSYRHWAGGHVISTLPKAAADRPVGTKVSLVVSKAPAK